MSTVIRKKNGFPCEEDALNATAILALSKICRAICTALPGLSPYITESYLAKLSFDFRYFMEDQLGKDSSKPHRSVKLPLALFRNFEIEGPLHVILQTLVTAMNGKNTDPCRFRESSKVEENFILFDKVKQALQENGFIKKRYFLIGESVPADVAAELAEIVVNHEAEITCEKETATHFLEWDSGVDGVLPEVLVEEYIRTVEIRRIVDVSPAASTSTAAEEAETDPFREGTALVHWWYHPDSYDEYIPSIDVDNSEIPESSVEELVGDSCGDCVWKVCCRYIRDVELFNEWGNELDYELDLEKEICAGGSNSKSASGSATVRGRGRQGRNKRKILPSSDDRHLFQKRKFDTFSPVLEASAGTEKAMAHLLPLSCAVHGIRKNIDEGGYVVLEAQLSTSSTMSSSIGDTSNVKESTSCTLSTETPHEVWGKKTESDCSHSQVGVSGAQRRRIGPNRHAQAYVVGMNGGHGSSSIEVDLKLPASAPSWFRTDSVSATEIRYMPDFFDGSSSFRTGEVYMSIRSFITNCYAQNTNVFLSATDCRKRMCGDAGTIIRVHSFLDAFKIINYVVPQDARPPVYPFSALNPLCSAGSFPKMLNESCICSIAVDRQCGQWTKEDDDALMKASLEHGDDWHSIGVAMGSRKSGSGVTSEYCILRLAELRSLDISIYDKKHITKPDPSSKSSLSDNLALQSLVNEYISARLRALEEKVKLLESVENIFNTEQRRQELDRRDLQIQKAQFAYHQNQNT